MAESVVERGLMREAETRIGWPRLLFGPAALALNRNVTGRAHGLTWRLALLA